jgi:hypothetical protein
MWSVTVPWPSRPQGGGYAQDMPLLDALVTDKLAAVAETVRAEGWSWTHVQPHLGYEERGRFGRCFPDDVELPEDEAALLSVFKPSMTSFSKRNTTRKARTTPP